MNASGILRRDLNYGYICWLVGAGDYVVSGINLLRTSWSNSTLIGAVFVLGGVVIYATIIRVGGSKGSNIINQSSVDVGGVRESALLL